MGSSLLISKTEVFCRLIAERCMELGALRSSDPLIGNEKEPLIL